MAGVVVVREVIAGLCLSEADQVNSTGDNVINVCINSRSSFSQCQAAEQTHVSAVAQFCSCRGGNLSDEDIQTINSSISLLRSLGVNTSTLSSNCRRSG